jgi:hypothetical protein
MKLKFSTEYHGYRQPMTQYKIFSHCVYETPKDAVMIKEPSFTYFDIYKLLNTHYLRCKTSDLNFTLDGYFQSYKYSLGYIPEIKQQLFANVPSDVAAVCDLYNEILNPIKCDGEKSNIEKSHIVISVHVRRGDYLQLSHFHTNQPDSYYEKSIACIIEQIRETDKITLIKLLIFSDDIDYIKKTNLHELWKLPAEINVQAVDLTETVPSFLLMTKCDHFVIANSSFSLLAYYFRDNANALLCLPERWFEPNGPAHNTSDLVELTKNVFPM